MDLRKEYEYAHAWFWSVTRNRAPVLRGLGAAIRLYPAWKASLELGSDSLTDRLPWITFEARSFIRTFLNPSDTVFEYGSGGSTIFYSKMAKQVFSVEHDEDYFNRVKASLAEEGIANCDCVLVRPEPIVQSNASPDDLKITHFE